MIRARLDRWRDALLRWLTERLATPAVNDIVRSIRKDLVAEMCALRSDAERTSRILLSAVTDARHEVRMLNDEMIARPATAEQMRMFEIRLDRVDDRLAHLAARMYGKNIADVVVASRGPRDFTHEDRQ